MHTCNKQFECTIYHDESGRIWSIAMMISAFRIYGLSETEAKGFHDNKANQILHTVGQLKFGVLFGIFLVWTLSTVLATVRFEIYKCVFLHSLLVKKEIILIYTRNSANRDILVW